MAEFENNRIGQVEELAVSPTRPTVGMTPSLPPPNERTGRIGAEGITR